MRRNTGLSFSNAHQRHVVQQLHNRLRFLSVDSSDCSNFSCCMKSSVQHPMLHWSNASNVKVHHLRLHNRLQQPGLFLMTFPGSLSEDLSSKMSIMAFHGTYGTSIIQSTKLPMENVFFALQLQFGWSLRIIEDHVIEIDSNVAGCLEWCRKTWIFKNTTAKRSQVFSIGRRLSASDSNSSPWLKHQWRLIIGAVSGESYSRLKMIIT